MIGFSNHWYTSNAPLRYMTVRERRITVGSLRPEHCPVHTTADVPVVDIAIKGGDVIENLGYGQLSDPLDVPAGIHDLEVRHHGSSEVVFNVPGVEVKPGVVYDIVAYGNPGDDAMPLTVAVLTDEARAGDPTATPSS